jgi:hemoglobin-like flavoprotein
MTPDQIALVRANFSEVAPIAEQAAAMFYGRLFEIDPSLKPLFKGDMKAQGVKLMAVLAVAVNNLDRLSTILPTVRELGRRHKGYGVKDGDYNTVAAALLDTLATALGEKFTPEARAAWTLCYLTLAREMKAGAALDPQDRAA